ncbi:MAG: 3'-5' exonuclease, partial [Thermoanaerobaculia bacterium]|nr:3'-5' exonuclease [Thermoanaerobaculia bacterium]
EEALLAAGGERQVLSRNFRSVPAVLDEVERVIEPVMRYRHGVQPAFHGLESTRPDPPADGAFRPIEYWVSWKAGDDGRLAPTNYTEAQEIEAEAVAADIRRLHESHAVPWSRFAILFRKSGSQPPFLDALRRLDVPFAVTRDRNYYQRREIIEAAAWVRSIVNPNDHLALVTVLRSSVVGVPDAALIPLWRHSLPRLITELGGPRDGGLAPIRRAIEAAGSEVPASIPGIDRLDGWKESLLAAIAALRRLRHAYRDEPADRFVLRLRSELLVEASEAARFQGKFRLANLGRFFRRLENALESDEADVHAVLRVLRLGVMEGREAEEATPREAAEEAVQVMTIHTAKGLEFDHVYLVQLHTGTRMGGDELLEVGEIAPGEWAYHLFGAPTPGFGAVEDRRSATEAAEAVRTLYVAMTRAAERLVMVGSWPAARRAKEPESARNYVDLVQNRRDHPESLAELANDPAVALSGHAELDGVRWRFPGGEHTFGGGRRTNEPADWLPDRAGFERLLDDHHRRRAAAIERQERPWTRAVTRGVSEALEVHADDLRSSEQDRPAAGLEERDLARRIGTEIHRCLEHWDLAADLDEETPRQREALLGRLAELSDRHRSEALERFDRLANGRLLRRLHRLAPHVVGREVPLLLRPDADDEAAGTISGAIDLLYRDPTTGALVVADFKTDRVDDPAELDALAEIYARQEELYGRAVRQAFDLADPPRTELWFLWPDRLWAGFRATEQSGPDSSAADPREDL